MTAAAGAGPGGGGGEEGAENREGFRGASGTRDCSGDPRDPALGRLLAPVFPNAGDWGHRSLCPVVRSPRENLLGFRMSLSHPGLRFQNQVNLVKKSENRFFSGPATTRVVNCVEVLRA